jgi:phospholipase C
VIEPNISDWRRKTFGDLTAAFRFADNKAAPPKLPETAKLLALAKQEALTLPPPVFPQTGKTLPIQEKGSRKRVPEA